MAKVVNPTIPLGPTPLDITGVRAGDLNLFTFHIHRNGTPVNLTGQEVTAQARKSAISDEIALTAVVTVTGAPNGDGTIRWPGDDVRDLLAGAATWKGVWDLQTANPGEDPVTLVAGAFAAEMDVTRS